MSAASLITAMFDALGAPGSPFELAETEVRGHTIKTYVAAPAETRHIWLGVAAADDDVYIVYEDERMTYGAARKRVLEIANALITDYGVQPGDSVGISMRNYPEWVLSWWAAQMIGACAVEMNAFWAGEELQYGVEDSGSRVLICDIERHNSLLPHLADIKANGLDLAMIVVRPLGELHDSATPWDELDGGTDIPAVEIDPDGRSAIVYTSGTTAFPKGVVHSQRNVVSNLMNMGLVTVALRMAEAAAQGEDPSGATGEEGRTIMLVAVPLFHVTGSHCVMLPITATGGQLVLMYKWDASKALELIERERVTHFTGVPTMTMDMLASPDFEGRDTSSITSMGSGGAPNPPHMVSEVNSKIENASAGIGYGLSEVSGIATLNGGIFYAEKPGTVGVQPSCSEMKVVDDDGNEQAPGERGELCIRGPHVFVEYHNKPEETAQSLDGDGWFHTGDIATIDEDGFVAIVDRAKDVIIRGGENVGSAEIEAVIAHHEDVHEVAAFGVPHERLGEEVAIAVHPLSGRSVNPAVLQQHAAEHLAAYKVPTHVFVYADPLPKNPNGKVLKRQLRDEATAKLS
ncbi:MAG: acyl--CoA ligase [Acidimicrobiales bacterium]|nr:acyl--CoA ligase [Acidimicrobiales bacterium]RZV48867.1 MAG: AMP-dependent synthetase [Acidimicrobiales bacterium]